MRTIKFVLKDGDRLTPMELARVSGHRDLKILMAHYYAPTVNDLAEKLEITLSVL